MEGKERRLAELERERQAEGFWDDRNYAAGVSREITGLEQVLARFKSAQSGLEDAVAHWLLVGEAGCAEGSADWREVESALGSLAADVDKLEEATLLDGEHDAQNAIVSIHAGAGGREAFDWGQMLFRMYSMWAARRGFSVEVTDETEGEGGGLNTVTFRVEGRFCYGLLRHESGVHRLVRISPFDAQKRRHTTFGSVDVVPEISPEADIEIREDDLRMEAYRASGAGGQHVNKTSSAVRLIHLPTGLVATCQNERSQHKNREVALKELKSRLLQLMEQQHQERIEDLRAPQSDVSWGNQIRNYVLQPYQVVKDQRSGFETAAAQKVLDGDLDGVMLSLLRWSKTQRTGSL